MRARIQRVSPRDRLPYKITIYHTTVVSHDRVPRLRHNAATRGSPRNRARKLVVRSQIVAFLNSSGSPSRSREAKPLFLILFHYIIDTMVIILVRPP